MPNNHFHTLKNKLQERHDNIKGQLVDKHKEAFDWLSSNTKQLAAGTMGSLLLLSSQTAPLLTDGNEETQQEQFLDVPENLFMVTDLKQYLPETVDAMHPSQEEKIAETLSKYYGLSVKPEIDGKRLMHTYGYIGAEQHLMRYPGDTMESHFENPNDAALYYSSGMAPGRGAWGYFASPQGLTHEDVQREKYYIAVQTFRAKDYTTRTSDYRDFFKFRKMLVVNPNTGSAVVVVIGDAGPAVWTKKQLGGSPEVMRHLQRVDGNAKGPVLYFFIDDPEDKVPLGPIEPKVTQIAQN